MTRRLIEEAFPLRRVSEDSRHEKSAGRSGHISTLHIWPARRPLAACRAAIIAALLPDPPTATGEIKREYERLAGTSDPVRQRQDLINRIERVTRWGAIDEDELAIFRGLLAKTQVGAPKVLDMFAGGGAIPLEAVRLGCDAVAVDYNPVAWLILKSTLEYPGRLKGRRWNIRPPADADPGSPSGQLRLLTADEGRTNLAGQVRLWGKWVLGHVEHELAPYFSAPDGKQPIAYFWTRTVPCQDPSCRASVPLLKTLWLSTKRGRERALKLELDHERRAVRFRVIAPGDSAEVGSPTVAGGKAFCPFHERPLILTDDYIKECGKQGQMGAQLTAVVVEGAGGKEYREPSSEETTAAARASEDLPSTMDALPLGPLNEPLCEVRPAPNTRGVSSLTRFGILTYGQVFTPRQQLVLSSIAKWSRRAQMHIVAMGAQDLADAVGAYLYCALARVADRDSSVCTWQTGPEKVHNTFMRYAFPMTWDFCEIHPSSSASGGYSQALEWVSAAVEHLTEAAVGIAEVRLQSATESLGVGVADAIITDPPYYGAIPYADLSDFFYVWLRRYAWDRYPTELATPLTPRDEELVQHAAFAEGNHDRARHRYEERMIAAFGHAAIALTPGGIMVIVFANKQPDAWETLVSTIIAAGFTVTASWPIDTERTAKVGSGKAAYLATSVWLVCRKRPETAGIGRYAEVKRQMQERITERLRYFWDQGISGPDFVWAAVGPALESYSSYREVRRIDGTSYNVGEFLRDVRRLVTDFALGQILHGASTEGLDEWTRYYLMHRSSFGLGPAPVGECILYAQGYGLDLNDLRGARGILAKGKGPRGRNGRADDDSGDLADEDGAIAGGSANDLRLLGFDERKREDLGRPHPSGGLPMIDMLHHLMQLWNNGDTERLASYAAEHGLGQNDLFWAVAQALVEQAEPPAKERTVLEALVAWGRGREESSYQRPLWRS